MNGNAVLKSSIGASLLAFSLLGASAPASATSTHACYAASADWDGDGYARTGAPSVQLTSTNDLYCPAGWIEKAGDCNDFNAAIHPRNEEYPQNGVDDNCDAGVDDAIPYYTGSGFDVTTNSFSAVVRLNDSQVRPAQRMGTPIKADVWLEPLTMSKTAKLIAGLPATYHEDGLVKVNITGLTSNTPYRAMFRFYFCEPYCVFTAWTTHYYSTTTGVTAKDKAAAKIVLSALKQFNDNKYQLVGYGYTLPGFPWRNPDGTRYGADFGEMWCSEFYSWVTKAYLNWNGSPPSNTEDMQQRFALAGGLYETWQAPWTVKQGDWFGLDSDGDGSMNHTALVLAYDQDKKHFWTIEGNSGNEVLVGTRTLNEVKAFGHIVNSMVR